MKVPRETRTQVEKIWDEIIESLRSWGKHDKAKEAEQIKHYQKKHYIKLKIKTWNNQPTLDEFLILHEQYGCVEETESDV